MNDGASTGTSYPWGHSRPFNDLAGYLKKIFGTRVQKLSVDAGFTCPNRDGTVGTGGCTFCNNRSFTPAYCSPYHTVADQLKRGMAFFSAKYADNQYLAYFQSYTNTYGPLERLIQVYDEALSVPGIIGLVIGTRPDCLPEPVLDYLQELAGTCYVSLELGIESTLDRTLARVNRGHSFQDTVTAFRLAAKRNLHTGGHLILGLPGETRSDMLGHALAINQLPINMIKIHQLQIIRGTPLADQYQEHPDDFLQFTAEEYIDLVISFLELLDPYIIVERYASVSSPGLLTGSRWGLKNYQLVTLIEREMVRRGTWQGRLFTPQA